MAGPYYGPRGGKWADPAHTIPWKEPRRVKPGRARGSKTFKPRIRRKKRTEVTSNPADRKGRVDDTQGGAAGWTAAPGSASLASTKRVQGRHEPKASMLRGKDRKAKRHADKKKGMKIASAPGNYGKVTDTAQAAIGVASARKDALIVRIKGKFLVTDRAAASHLKAAGFKVYGGKKVAKQKTAQMRTAEPVLSPKREAELRAASKPKVNRDHRITGVPLKITPVAGKVGVSHFEIYDPQGDDKKPMAVLAYHKKSGEWRVRATKRGKTLAASKSRMGAVQAWREMMGLNKSSGSGLRKAHVKLTMKEAKAVLLTEIKSRCYRYFKYQHGGAETSADDCAGHVTDQLIREMKYDKCTLDGIRAIGGVDKLCGVVCAAANLAECNYQNAAPPSENAVASPPFAAEMLMRSGGGMWGTLAMLAKGRALPPGTRRRHGGVWKVKQGDGTWVNDPNQSHRRGKAKLTKRGKLPKRGSANKKPSRAAKQAGMRAAMSKISEAAGKGPTSGKKTASKKPSNPTQDAKLEQMAIGDKIDVKGVTYTKVAKRAFTDGAGKRVGISKVQDRRISEYLSHPAVKEGGKNRAAKKKAAPKKMTQQHVDRIAKLARGTEFDQGQFDDPESSHYSPSTAGTTWMDHVGPAKKKTAKKQAKPAAAKKLTRQHLSDAAIQIDKHLGLYDQWEFDQHRSTEDWHEGLQAIYTGESEGAWDGEKHPIVDKQLAAVADLHHLASGGKLAGKDAKKQKEAAMKLARQVLSGKMPKFKRKFGSTQPEPAKKKAAKKPAGATPYHEITGDQAYSALSKEAKQSHKLAMKVNDYTDITMPKFGGEEFPSQSDVGGTVRLNHAGESWKKDGYNSWSEQKTGKKADDSSMARMAFSDYFRENESELDDDFDKSSWSALVKGRALPQFKRKFGS